MRTLVIPILVFLSACASGPPAAPVAYRPAEPEREAVPEVTDPTVGIREASLRAGGSGDAAPGRRLSPPGGSRSFQRIHGTST